MALAIVLIGAAIGASATSVALTKAKVRKSPKSRRALALGKLRKD